MKRLIVMSLIVISLMAVSCKKQSVRIKLATTTSTENTGLLDYLLPIFEKEKGISVDVIAVGTGKALKHGENGDVDVVLVHARSLEDQFVADGFGVNRKDVMYNDFVMVADPSLTEQLSAGHGINELMQTIAAQEIPFISRGDNSGTHVKELELWETAGVNPIGTWYREAGQGMDETLRMTFEMKAVTLSDRGTFITGGKTLGLDIVYEKDGPLLNPYGVIAVNPDIWEHAKFKEAMIFIDWLTSNKGKGYINSFTVDGDQLFFAE